MKITLNELKKLVAQIINEGADDLKELQKLYPNEAEELAGTPFFVNGQPTKWFRNWLVPRFLTGQAQKEFPLEHEVYSARDYANNEPAIKAAFMQPVFKEALDAAFPPRFRLNNLDDPLRLTVYEMDGILEVFYEYKEKREDRLGIDYDAIDVEGDRLGKIGPWNIWMPTTRETSCTIVRVRDPKTGKMKKTPCSWCTARTDGSNLFYSYTTRPYENIILYYLIRDNPETNKSSNNDFISIGFINGVPDMTGTTGGVTVRCDNKGLKKQDLKRIFDVNYTSIINFLTQKTKEIGGQHPAKTKLEAAAQSLDALNYLMKGISREERAELATQVLSYGQRSGKINPDIEKNCFEYAASSNQKQTLYSVVVNYKCPPHILENLINRVDKELLQNIAHHHNCPQHVLIKLFNGDDDETGYNAFHNQNFPKEIKDDWELLSNHKNKKIKHYVVAKNPRCPPHILVNLFNDDDDVIGWDAFINPNFPAKIKKDWKLLSNHRNYRIKAWAARDLECPPQILENLINDDNSDNDIKRSVVSNQNCPEHVLIKLFNGDINDISYLAFMNVNFPKTIKNDLELLSNHKNPLIRKEVTKYPSCPLHILEKLFHDENESVSMAVLNKGAFRSKIDKYSYEFLIKNKHEDVKLYLAQFHYTPLSVLEKLSTDKDYMIKSFVAVNPMCPLPVLEKLSKSVSNKVKSNVALNKNCTPDILRKLSTSPNNVVKKYVLYNKNCPEDVVIKLRSDQNRTIKKLANGIKLIGEDDWFDWQNE